MKPRLLESRAIRPAQGHRRKVTASRLGFVGFWRVIASRLLATHLRNGLRRLPSGGLAYQLVGGDF